MNQIAVFVKILISGGNKFRTHCNRRVVTYSFLVILTAIFIIMYSVDYSVIWVQWPSPRDINTTEPNITFRHGFLVYSDSCQIPYVNPYHPVVKQLISTTKPLMCDTEYIPVTIADGDVVKIQEHMLPEFVQNSSYTCCYRGIYRKNDGVTDNEIRIDEKCTEFKRHALIDDEFIKVECSSNGTIFYKNFHSFIHDKSDVEKRCREVSRRRSDKKQYSILIVGVDSVSRLNMHRQLKKTVKFLKTEMGAIEMYGYNKVGDNTFPNVVALLMGYHDTELSTLCRKYKDPMDNCSIIWKRFAERGYRTLYAEDTPGISTFNYLKKGFLHQPTDYYFRHFMLPYEKELGWNRKLNCHLCVGPVSETEVVLSWVHKFAVNFKNRPYFAFAWINSLTHDFLNMGSAGDYLYERFFKTLHAGGYLENTIIIFLSDHGMRWGKIRNTHIGRMEERLPMLLVTFPPSFVTKYTKIMRSLKINSHRLITPFNLYATLSNLLDFDGQPQVVDVSTVPNHLSAVYSKRALSLFQPVPENRSCTDASVDEAWCTCQQTKPVSIDDVEVKHVSDFIVRSINDIVLPYKDVCVNLSLDSIKDARLYAPSSHLHVKENYNIYDYAVVVRTSPGDGIFEGTVRYLSDAHTHELLGSVSRLNLYGKQSWCVQNAIARKYCYCKKQKTSLDNAVVK